LTSVYNVFYTLELWQRNISPTYTTVYLVPSTKHWLVNPPQIWKLICPPHLLLMRPVDDSHQQGEVLKHFSVMAATARIHLATHSFVDAWGNFALLNNFAWDNSLRFHLRNELTYLRKVGSRS
jgi:hypothetical protein